MSNQDKLYIDIGSSTIKVYKKSGNSFKHILSHSIDFKKDFTPEKGLSTANKKKLYQLFQKLKQEHPSSNFKTLATALFRNLTPKEKRKFKKEFSQKTGLEFNIITQEQENIYLELALVGMYQKENPVLLINIGGGSTELVVMLGRKVLERKNINLGVGTVITNFSKINNKFSGVALKKITHWVQKRLPSLENKTDIAFYTGGELTYMQRAGYPLEKNYLFADPDHPKVINLNEFVKRNKEIFSKVTLGELENMMPENPRWMHGARACSALAQSICSTYNIKTIIPSNSNIAHGAARQDSQWRPGKKSSFPFC